MSAWLPGYQTLFFLLEDVVGGDGDGKKTFGVPGILPPNAGMQWGVCAGSDAGGAVFPSPG